MEPLNKDAKIDQDHFSEADAGIQEFLAPADMMVELPCTVKHRYSDFIVNEIDETGEVIWFRSELHNEQKWRPQNMRDTLPEAVLR